MSEPLTDKENSNMKSVTSNDNLERIKVLSQNIDELNTLCRELDPYQEISKEMMEQLSKYGVFTEDNPFVITNKLVLILENSVEELIELGGDPIKH